MIKKTRQTIKKALFGKDCCLCYFHIKDYRNIYETHMILISSGIYNYTVTKALFETISRVSSSLASDFSASLAGYVACDFGLLDPFHYISACMEVRVSVGVTRTVRGRGRGEGGGGGKKIKKKYSSNRYKVSFH